MDRNLPRFATRHKSAHSRGRLSSKQDKPRETHTKTVPWRETQGLTVDEGGRDPGAWRGAGRPGAHHVPLRAGLCDTFYETDTGASPGALAMCRTHRAGVAAHVHAPLQASVLHGRWTVPHVIP